MKSVVISHLTKDSSLLNDLKANKDGILEDVWLIQPLQITYFGVSSEKTLIPCQKTLEDLKKSLQEEDVEAYYITSNPFPITYKTMDGKINLLVKISIHKFRDIIYNWILSKINKSTPFKAEMFMDIYATKDDLPTWLEIVESNEEFHKNENDININSLKVGDKLFDLYQVDAEIGSGGMGKVYLATDTKSALESTRRVVLKVLHPEFINQAGSNERIVKEAKILIGLHHKNIAQCLNCRTHGQTPVMIMEYIEGETLQEYLMRQAAPLNEDEVKTLLRPIAQAIDYAHEQGVYHLDLKPANIILRTLKNGQREAVLLDFSIAKLIQPDVTITMMNVNAGTRPYMSPQQLMGQEVSRAMDVYALAVTAYQCLTGRLPYPSGYSEKYNLVPLVGESLLIKSIMNGLSASEENRPRTCISLIDPIDIPTNSEIELPIEEENEIFTIEESYDEKFSDLERRILQQFQIMLIMCAEREHNERRKDWLKNRVQKLYNLVQAETLDVREELISFFDDIRFERKKCKTLANRFFTATAFLQNLRSTLPTSGSRVLKAVFLCVND